MLTVSSLAECDNALIPERHQNLLRFKLLHFLIGYGNTRQDAVDNKGLAQRLKQCQCRDQDKVCVCAYPSKPSYDPEVDGYLVYLQVDDVESKLSSLGLEYRLIDLVFSSVVFCDYSQCFDAILYSDHDFTYHFIIPSDLIPIAVRQHFNRLCTVLSPSVL